MALYVTRPRRDEVRIGRGLPSATGTLTPKKKDESFLDKLGGTLARKKKAKEGF